MFCEFKIVNYGKYELNMFHVLSIIIHVFKIISNEVFQVLTCTILPLSIVIIAFCCLKILCQGFGEDSPEHSSAAAVSLPLSRCLNLKESLKSSFAITVKDDTCYKSKQPFETCTKALKNLQGSYS